jgi:hypothetical protein
MIACREPQYFSISLSENGVEHGEHSRMMADRPSACWNLRQLKSLRSTGR